MRRNGLEALVCVAFLGLPGCRCPEESEYYQGAHNGDAYRIAVLTSLPLGPDDDRKSCESADGLGPGASFRGIVRLDYPGDSCWPGRMEIEATQLAGVLAFETTFHDGPNVAFSRVTLADGREVLWHATDVGIQLPCPGQCILRQIDYYPAEENGLPVRCADAFSVRFDSL